MVGNILRWFAGIGAALKKPAATLSRPSEPEPDIAAAVPAKAAAENAKAPPPAHEIGAKPRTAKVPAPAAADAKTARAAETSRIATPPAHPPDEQEIQRRRELVRTWFNDFWSEADDKPAAFADRLDQAETYLNERLASCGEIWQLDAKTRKVLGLPPRSNSYDEGTGAARR